MEINNKDKMNVLFDEKCAGNRRSFGLAEIIKDENASGKNIFVAAVSLLIILAGVVTLTFG